MLFGLSAGSHAAVGVRLLMGLTDTGGVVWDGSATVSGGRITKIEPWRFDVETPPNRSPLADSIGGTFWVMSTHRLRWFRHEEGQPPFVANGVIVWLAGENDSTQLEVKTKQGEFRVRLSDIPYGTSRKLLSGRVAADRIPPYFRITNTPDEQDYPAVAADKAGHLWLAYVEFHHNQDHDRIRTPFQRRPSNFDDMVAPTGGDQIIVRRFTGDVWGPPIEITPPGGDVYRPSIAVDGAGRPWVFWSENLGGNFDIWARVIENGRAGSKVQLSSAPGSDIDPAATTDSKGRVWVAWQGWRSGKASIFAATQDNLHFSPASVVATSAGNEWNPAIAADNAGRVSVAWIFIATATTMCTSAPRLRRARGPKRLQWRTPRGMRPTPPSLTIMAEGYGLPMKRAGALGKGLGHLRYDRRLDLSGARNPAGGA